MRKLAVSLMFSALASFIASSPAQAASAPPLKISSASVAQGDTLVLSFSSPVKIKNAALDGTALHFFSYRGGLRAIAPVSPTAKTGLHKIKITLPDGKVIARSVQVKKRNFPLVDMGVPDTVDASPEQVVQKLGSIQADLSKMVNAYEAGADFKSGFMMPLKKFVRYGSPFGELRKTGSSYVRHLGTDFTAPVGTPVLAINDGVVRLATSTDLYGNTVIIDHGEGIYSLYLHLDQTRTQAGKNIKKGETLGTLGATGYAFGPHLHLSVKINGVSVDPVRFIQSFR